MANIERVLDSSFLDQLCLNVLTGFHFSCIVVAHIRSKSAYTDEVVDLCLDCEAVGGVGLMRTLGQTLI